jgi:hypothetical protein
MKDYHDAILMIREEGLLDLGTLRATLKATFVHRGTSLELPFVFDDRGMTSLDRLWKNHISGLGVFREKLHLPESIEGVILELNQWLKINKAVNE